MKAPDGRCHPEPANVNKERRKCSCRNTDRTRAIGDSRKALAILHYHSVGAKMWPATIFRSALSDGDEAKSIWLTAGAAAPG